MKKILYVNHSIAKTCGVYDLGLRHFLSIRNIPEYKVTYTELNSIKEYFEICDLRQPDAVIFNYMPITCQWLTDEINQYKCTKICIPHLFIKNDIKSFRNDLFDYYIILDKNSIEDEVCFKTDRPLTTFNNENITKNNIPTIGSFGFAFTHKFFNRVVAHVNECFDEAEINIHMPKAHFNAVDETGPLTQLCLNEITKPGIRLNVNTTFLEEEDAIKELNKNDINCLFYESHTNLGISASLDYLVSAQKPILITASEMFRSFSDSLPIYPNNNLREMYSNYDQYQNDISSLYNKTVNNIKTQTKDIFDRILK
jgi:hypothetical protein